MPLINTDPRADAALTVTVQGLSDDSTVTYDGRTAASLTLPSMQRFEAVETSLNDYLASVVGN